MFTLSWIGKTFNLTKSDIQSDSSIEAKKHVGIYDAKLYLGVPDHSTTSFAHALLKSFVTVKLSKLSTAKRLFLNNR